MTETEFTNSLTPDQTLAMSTLLISHRSSLQAMYSQAEASLVAAQKAIANDLAVQLTTVTTEYQKEIAAKTEAVAKLEAIIDVLPENTDIKAIQKQRKIAEIESQELELAKRKDEIINPKLVVGVIEEKTRD